MKKSKLTQELVKRVLDYDPVSGIFRWKVSLSRRVTAGERAGVVASNGRRYIAVFNEKHLAHRLAWFYVHGEWTDGNVVLVNGNYDDSSLANLRIETPSETAQRGKLRATNLSGHRGVSWASAKRKWVAVITRAGRRFHLGYFDTPEDAAKAYECAAQGLPKDGGASADWTKIRKFRHKMRIEWNRVTAQCGGINPWPTFELFLAEIPKPPSWEYRLLPLDAGCPLGSGNFAWTPLPGKSIVKRPFGSWRKNDLMRDFGITLEQYDAMSDRQGGVCAICGQAERSKRDGKTKQLAVDHNHKTGALRGLLCSYCNPMIGYAKENPSILRKAVEYLERHNGQPTLEL